MTISGIKDNVQELLTSTDEFVTVLAAPPAGANDFNGYPAASHYYVGAESDFATVSQNRRRYEYVIEIYLVTNSDTPTATELSEMYALTDTVVQLLEETRDLSSTSLGLSRACDFMKVSPSTLDRVQTTEGTGLMSTIRMFCEADVSII